MSRARYTVNLIFISRSTQRVQKTCLVSRLHKTLPISKEKKKTISYLKVILLKFYVIISFIRIYWNISFHSHLLLCTSGFVLCVFIFLAFLLLALFIHLSIFGDAYEYKRVLAQSSSYTNLSGHVLEFRSLIRMDFRHQLGSDSATHVFNFPKSSGVWSIVARESRSCTKPRHDVQGVPSTIAVYSMEKKSPRSPLPVDPIDSRFT